MSSTERIRDPERTRATILAAFGRLVQERGAGVSLAEVAEAAGVTKSGLMHHFRSRDELVEGYVSYGVERFWTEVQEHLDYSESRPGQFTRAYVRLMTGDSTMFAEWASTVSLIAQLGSETTMSVLERIAPGDADRLNAAFEADGLPAERTLLIRFAADGLAVAAGTPYATPEQVEALRAQLFALSEAGQRG